MRVQCVAVPAPVLALPARDSRLFVRFRVQHHSDIALEQEPSTHSCLLRPPQCLAGEDATRPCKKMDKCPGLARFLSSDVPCSCRQAIVAKAPTALQMEDILGRKPVSDRLNDEPLLMSLRYVHVLAQSLHAVIRATV